MLVNKIFSKFQILGYFFLALYVINGLIAGNLIKDIKSEEQVSVFISLGFVIVSIIAITKIIRNK
tara:strand:+ start:246 stop:440 length:195 start_codon:yes stop_codon:yes gene_type:complete